MDGMKNKGILGLYEKWLFSLILMNKNGLFEMKMR